jgi:catabolite regulation protein CreA
MDVNCEVGAADKKVVAAKIVVEEATAPLVKGTCCEVVGLDKGHIYEKETFAQER